MAIRDIAIGKIVGTYGNRGMVKVFPLTDFPDRFFGMNKVVLEQEGRQKEYTVVEAERRKKHVLLKLGEIPDMTGAEGLKGALIKVDRDELTVLSKDSYYIFDIVGLKVFTADGAYAGVVEDVIQTGANDVYVVSRSKKAPLLVPALKEVIKEIDIQTGKMVVDYEEIE